MSYSFVRLYLSKCDVCVLNHIWFNPKRFLIILYVFGSDFYHFFVFMFSVYFVFQCLNMFCFEKQVSEFLATHFGYLRELPILATCFGNLQAASLHKRVLRVTRDLARNLPVAKRPKSAF